MWTTGNFGVRRGGGDGSAVGERTHGRIGADGWCGAHMPASLVPANFHQCGVDVS